MVSGKHKLSLFDLNFSRLNQMPLRSTLGEEMTAVTISLFALKEGNIVMLHKKEIVCAPQTITQRLIAQS